MIKQAAATRQRRRILRGRRNIIIIVAFIIFIFGAQTILISNININNNNNYNNNIISPRNTPDAYFNNYPLYLRENKNYNNKEPTNNGLYDGTFHSTVHCVGETHDVKTAWKHRSCNYVHLCLDFSSSSNNNNNNNNNVTNNPPEFFVVASQFDEEFRKRFHGSSESSPLSKGGIYHYSSSELGSGNNNKNDGVINDKQHEQQYSSIDVALGGINPRWKGSTKIQRHGFDKVRWTPKIYDKFPNVRYYYELENDVVMIPFHSFAADNVGHLLWDDLLPIYNLLKIFGYENNANNNNNQDNINININININNNDNDNKYRHLFIRVDTLSELYATCDLRLKKKRTCQENFERFLPLFGVNPETFTTLTEIRLSKIKSSSSSSSSLLSQSSIVCSKHAVAGLGWLTDHGIRDHGWMTNNEPYSLDVAIARNVGRGPELYAFRNYLLRNMGLLTTTTSKTTTTSNVDKNSNYNQQPIQFRIILSAYSSNHPDRDFGLEEQRKALSEAFPTIDVSTVVLRELSLREQIELISQPKQQTNKEHIIFVTACGGGSITGFFLPKDSSMILYYPESGGYDFSSKFNLTGGKAMLDWDLLNNLGYIRTHWLPIGTMNELDGLDALVYLVRHEMDVTMNSFV
jgi:hypothetical protein